MELFIHKEVHAYAGIVYCDSCANHLLLIAHDHIHGVDTDTSKRREVAVQEGLPPDLDQALRAMLRDLPQPFSDPGCKDDGFHAVPQIRSNASRNPPNCASVRAPMFATRKILL